MSQSDSTEETIFEAARRLGDPEKQAAYLDSACGKDPVLRQRIEQLLRAGQRASDFFQRQGATLRVPNVTVAHASEAAGTIIGRYKLLQQIGEGGCGVVYMAEQEEPVRRRVALKVIKLGMDTKQVIARFEAERQALALMDHPNIAKVLDAGATDSGRPFFVMELVRGIRITDYCDQNKLSTNERLNLFTQVCRAVQHAHQKGIIHRDIKPSNVLVASNDGVPVPKVIDFGIAKATQGRLTDQTVFTAFEQFIGTPAYMSPEQAEMTMLDIDTRTDIYALGVLLYELLTGRTPFDGKELLAAGLDEMRRTIREVEPVKPSTRLTQERLAALAPASLKSEIPNSKYPKSEIAQDLDWIVMKCLEKDRARRYDTANGLAMDVQHFLSDEPIRARPPSKLYRFRKTVRRNKLAFTAGAAVLAALVMGLGISTFMFFQEKAARKRAVAAEYQANQARASEAAQRRQADDARKQAQDDQRKALAEASKARQLFSLLKQAFESVGPSVAKGRDATMLREILDRTAERIGKALTNQPEVELEMRVFLANTYHELAAWPKMEESARQSLQLARSVYGETNVYVEDALYKLGAALMPLGRLDEAEKIAREALNHPLLADESSRGKEKANALGLLAQILSTRGKPAEAETLERQALALERQSPGNEEGVATCLNNLANTLQDEGKLLEAESMHREALAMRRKKLGDEHVDIAASLNNLANVLRVQGKVAEAETMFRDALAMRRKLLGNEHPAVATCLHNLATVLVDQGKLPEAEYMFREAIAMRQKRLGKDDPSLPAPLKHLAHVLKKRGKLAEAEAMLREALRIQKKVVGNEHPRVANLLDDLAEVLRDRNALTEALSLAEEAAAMYPRHPDWPLRERDHALEVLADVKRKLANFDKAEK